MQNFVINPGANLVEQWLAYLIETISFPYDVCDVAALCTTEGAGVVLSVPVFRSDYGVPCCPLLDDLEEAAVGFALHFVRGIC